MLASRIDWNDGVGSGRQLSIANAGSGPKYSTENDLTGVIRQGCIIRITSPNDTAIICVFQLGTTGNAVTTAACTYHRTGLLARRDEHGPSLCPFHTSQSALWAAFFRYRQRSKTP